MTQLNTETLLIYETVSEDGSTQVSITSQTNPENGDEVSFAVIVGQAILDLFEDGTILDHVNTMMGWTGENAAAIEKVEVTTT